MLDFEQYLMEDATLEITNTAGQLVFQKSVNASDKKYNWCYNVGKLQPYTYLVEVKTAFTTYWSRFKVSRYKNVQTKSSRYLSNRSHVLFAFSEGLRSSSTSGCKMAYKAVFI